MVKHSREQPPTFAGFSVEAGDHGVILLAGPKLVVRTVEDGRLLSRARHVGPHVLLVDERAKRPHCQRHTVLDTNSVLFFLIINLHHYLSKISFHIFNFIGCVDLNCVPKFHSPGIPTVCKRLWLLCW